MPAHIGVTGLAVMGANLARNLARKGFTAALHKRSVEKTDALLEKQVGAIKAGATSVSEPPARKLILDTPVDAQFNMPFGAGGGQRPVQGRPPSKRSSRSSWMPR